MTSELGNSGPTSNATEPVRRVGPDGAGFERLAGALRDRYHIVREIGRGGAAYVYLAIDLRSNENIALKVLRPEFSVAVGEARFQREIEIASELRHPNVLSLLDFGTADGRLYFTMPFVEGESLSIRIRRDRQMRLHDAIVIARDVAKALDYAHERGVIHRDIKPANILLSAKGIHVADFGIARAMRVVTGEEITDSGVVVGTPEYMSPEQATAAKGLDGRSDVYALGCVAYEMIAGEPPFTGPSAQAVLARHCHEKPRSIRIIRPAIPLGVERAIEQALAKVPADRFETAGAFIDALEAGTDARTDVFGLTRLTRRTRRLVGGTLILLAAAVAWTVFHMRPPALDRSRIVVFPLYEASTVGGSEAGEQVATLIGYALDGTRPLKWLDGWDLFDSAQRNSGNRLDARRARQISERVGAGFYLDGSILRQLDSVTVLLQLFSVLGDSVVRRVGVSGPATASLPHLGLEALRRMLPDLVAPGGTIDVSALTDRRLPAVLNFLQGEREYRRMQFAAALPHYQAALRDDSAFALAAFRGSYTASWLSESASARQLVTIALAHTSDLSPAQALVARGLDAYLTGASDSAIHYLRRAQRADSTVHAAWTLLGEVYSRLLPLDRAADSLARAALDRARAADGDFAPTLLLLEEFALRDGNVKLASSIRGELQRAGADTSHATARELMHRCVRSGPTSVDWRKEVQDNANAVLGAGKVLGGRAAQPQCAIPAFDALLHSQTANRRFRWAGLEGLRAQRRAVGQDIDIRDAEIQAIGPQFMRITYFTAAMSGKTFEEQARSIADTVVIAKAPPIFLWLLGSFELSRHDVQRGRSIFAELRRKADSTKSPQHVRLARAIEARLRVVEGDTVAAILLLRSLQPVAPRLDIAWWPWESFGAEQLLLAQLLEARGEHAEALAVASHLDATEPIGFPYYLRDSLQLRARVADLLGDAIRANGYRQRLRTLDSCCAVPSS